MGVTYCGTAALVTLPLFVHRDSPFWPSPSSCGPVALGVWFQPLSFLVDCNGHKVLLLQLQSGHRTELFSFSSPATVRPGPAYQAAQL
jgi:hypothetical protein